MIVFDAGRPLSGSPVSRYAANLSVEDETVSDTLCDRWLCSLTVEHGVQRSSKSIYETTGRRCIEVEYLLPTSRPVKKRDAAAEIPVWRFLGLEEVT